MPRYRFSIFAATVPNLFLSPIAGAYVDRWDKKQVLIVSDLLRAAVVLLVPVGVILHVSLAYVLIFALTVVSLFFRPARAAILPQIVDEEDLVPANSALWVGDSIGELCTSCHAEKRGPFLWEHAPSRDGCATCHDPHGTSNERMLVSKPPILCQRCHVSTRHPSTIYDAALIGSGASPSVRIYARSCVTCHSAIHGSNHPSGQRFIR